MNYWMIAYSLGWILNFEALFLLPALVVALIYKESAGMVILVTAAICASAGTVLILRKPKRMKIFAREGFIITALSWITLSVFGAIPFVLSGYIPHMVDAIFEVASGFTTTGASILTDVEALPHCLLFWRSFTHWVGGMGVLVFVIAILPLAGVSNMYLMKAESPGPSVKKLVPTVRSSAMMLYSLYLFITACEFLILIIARMPAFDALTLTFGTAGTGGFGVLNDSLGSYTILQQVIVTVFMILFGVNFNVYYLIYKRKIKDALKNSEVVTYLSIITVSIVMITINIYHLYGHFGLALKDAAFQVGSIITTTGFSTTDFNLWPSFAKTVLVMLMFIGACAGSTGGGIKVSRVVMLFKTVLKEQDYYLHPNNVRRVKVDGKQVEHTVIRSVNVFIMAYILVFCGSLLLITLDNFDLVTNFTAVAATLNNIGPGLSLVGPAANYSIFSPFAKAVLTFDMIAGRLELFPVLILFSWKTWRNR